MDGGEESEEGGGTGEKRARTAEGGERGGAEVRYAQALESDVLATVEMEMEEEQGTALQSPSAAPSSERSDSPDASNPSTESAPPTQEQQERPTDTMDMDDQEKNQ